MSKPKQPLQYGKLTKKFLMSLPEGVFLATGVGYSPGNPVVGEIVAPLDKREEQWNRIKERECNGRNCDVFESREHYIEFWKTVPRSQKSPSEMTPKQKEAAVLLKALEQENN